MPFEKGHKKLGGKKKGSLNKKTEQWNLLSESIVNEHTERFNQVLSGLKDREFINAYLQVLEYFKPKLQRTELTGEDGGDIKIDFTK